MKITRNLGLLLLAVWLIATGLIAVLGLSFTGLGTILAVLAIGSGVVILFGLRGKSFSRNIGWILLGIWLVLQGLISLVGLNFAGLDLLLGLLALVAGALILIGR